MESMRVILFISSLVLTVFFSSCAAPLTSYVEPQVSTPTAKYATINSYVSGLDYLAITAIDGQAVPKSSSYKLAPGKRKINMSSVYKGLTIDKMSYTVQVEAGKSYSLKPVMGEVKETWTPTMSEFRSEGFMPLFIDDATGTQLYPPLPKTKKGAQKLSVKQPAPSKVKTLENTLKQNESAPVKASPSIPEVAEPKKRAVWY